MKGVKLLFTALLCLATGGAWAQYVYDENATDTASFSWSSGNVQVSASDYSYNYIIIDKKRGLKYFIPDPSADTYWSAYVGLDGDYKTSTNPVTSVAIPSEITYTITANFSGVDKRVTRTRYVTVIVDEGFTTTLNGDIPDNDNTDGNGYQIYKAYDSNGNLTTYRHNRKNPYLKEVTFLPGSDGKYRMQLIGQRAFQGCVHLESAMVPPSVTTMGESTFAMCFRLKDFEFATESKTVDGAVQESTSLTKVPDNCFYQCNAMQSIEVPYGVTEIGDYAFQDNWNLKQITLPNTLTHIGAHFLCRAKSLTSFYVPSSVTYIDGAFLHGCESMRDVYLLGSAAYLEYDATGSTGDASKTFEEYDETYFNPYCKAVQNCTFHVTNADHAGYIGSTLNNGTNVWLEVYGGSNGVYGKDGAPDTYDSTDDGIQHNRIIWNEESKPEYTRDFGPYKWVSVIFYQSIPMSTFKSTFGDGALAATYTDCYKDNASSKVYHLGFTTISSTGMVPAKTPLMIYIGNKTVKGYQMNTDNTETADWKAFYTQRYNVEQSVRIGSRTSTNYASGESVNMVGLPVPIPMHENEFYFKWVDAQDDGDYTNPNTHYGRIRRCVNAGDSYKGRFSCFWQIKKNGVRVQDAQLSSAKGMIPMEDDLNSPTGINEVETEKPASFDVNIYDINGRLVGTSHASLPKGLYIQGGKKFIKK